MSILFVPLVDRQGALLWWLDGNNISSRLYFWKEVWWLPLRSGNLTHYQFLQIFEYNLFRVVATPYVQRDFTSYSSEAVANTQAPATALPSQRLHDLEYES